MGRASAVPVLCKSVQYLAIPFAPCQPQYRREKGGKRVRETVKGQGRVAATVQKSTLEA